MTITTDSVKGVYIHPACMIPENEMVGVCVSCDHQCTITLTDGRVKTVVLSGEDVCCLAMKLGFAKVPDYDEDHFAERLDIFAFPSDYGRDYKAILKRAFE